MRIPSTRELVALFQDSPQETPHSPIIQQEFGVTQESYFTRFPLFQYSPDKLITKKKFDAYEAMMTDDQIAMCITALKVIRLSSGYEVIEASDDPADIEIADFVADVLESVEGGIHQMLFKIMGSLEMGWSIHEKVWDFYDKGPYKGRVRMKALKSKNPKYYNPEVDDFNNVTGVILISPPAYGRKLPKDKFLIYSFEKRYENVFGTSRIRPLYQWWWTKQVLIRAMGVYAEKYGMPIPVGFASPQMTAGQRAAFLQSLTSLRFEHALVLPDGTKVEFQQPPGGARSGMAGFIEAINKADTQIVKVLMGQTMTTGTGVGHGSGTSGSSSGGARGGQGGASQQMDIMVMYEDYLGQDMSENAVNHLIHDIVDFNYAGVVKYPRLQFKELAEEDLAQSVTTFQQAAQAGIVTPTADDEEHIREVLKFPSQSEKSKLRPTKGLNRIVLVTPSVSKPLDPRDLPVAVYRPPTPSAPGLPANYAETDIRLFKGVRRRSFTKYESKVDFAEALSTMEHDGVKAISPRLAKVLRKGINKVVEDVRRSDILKGKDLAAARKLVLPYKGDINAVLKDGLQSVCRDAQKAAKRELRARARRHAELFDDIQNLDPQEVMDYVRSKSYTITDAISSDVEQALQTVVMNGIRDGDTLDELIYQLQGALGQFVDDAGDTADVDLAGNRLETIVRTNVNDAYNQGKLSIYRDPDLGDFVQGLQYSAIMDDRVRENHAANDGLVWLLTNPVWDDRMPPNGFNCRCTVVPVVQGDGWDGTEDGVPKGGEPDDKFK